MFPQIHNVYSYTNPDYLDANRRGEISVEQAQLLGPARKFLTKKFHRSPKLSGFVVIGGLILLGAAQLLGIELTMPILMSVFGLVLVILAVQLGTRMVKSRRQESHLKQDLDRGQVREAVGVLQFSGNSYQVQLSDTVLQLPFGAREELVPGASYRFYYLPLSGMILSAEAEGEIDSQAVETGLTQTLANANGFNLSALSANRQGKLDGEQVSLLLSFLVGPLIFLLVPGGLLYLQLQRGGYLSGNSFLEIVTRLQDSGSTGTLLAVGLLSLAALAGVVMLIMTLLDMVGGTVRVVEGTGYRKITSSTDDDGSRTNRLYYVVGGIKFRVQQKGFNAFEEGLKYRAYYTPLRKVLVNIEVVEGMSSK